MSAEDGYWLIVDKTGKVEETMMKTENSKNSAIRNKIIITGDLKK